MSHNHFRLCYQFPTVAIALFLLLSACTSNVQPVVTQFGQAVTTTASAEDALFDAIDQRKKDARNLCVLSSKSIDIPADKFQITPKDVRCQAPDDPDGTKEIPADVRKAIDGVLGAIQAYGNALQSLASDTAATTFGTNVDSLGQSLTAFDTSVLTPLGGKGLPTQAQLNAVGQAVKDVGTGLIAFAISRDVKSAAKKMQTPLHTIAGAFGGKYADPQNNINKYWTDKIPAILSNEIRPYIIGLWPRSSISDKQALQTACDKAAAPITPDAANKAWDALVAANDQIVATGPTASIAEIKSAWQAANDAYAAYKAIVGK
jgi:hypothetical protein